MEWNATEWTKSHVFFYTFSLGIIPFSDLTEGKYVYISMDSWILHLKSDFPAGMCAELGLVHVSASL
jgi:hypothetical protein